MIELNDKNYNKIINEETIKDPMAFVFSSDWCVYCKSVLKKIDRINKDKQKPCDFKIYYINEKNSRKILEKFSIRAFPTIIFFKDGKIFNFLIGDSSIESLVENFEKICPKKKKKFFFF
jgi:thioredoxin-like negative regulator of GroEL